MTAISNKNVKTVNAPTAKATSRAVIMGAALWTLPEPRRDSYHRPAATVLSARASKLLLSATAWPVVFGFATPAPVLERA